MWNMNLTLPTLMIMAVIAVAYMSRKHLPLRISRAFEVLLIVSIVTLLLDYASTLMDTNAAKFQNWMLWAVNYLFFFSFLARSFMLFWMPLNFFNSSDLKREAQICKWVAIGEQIFLLIGSVCGWIFKIENHTYVSGPLYPFINLQMLAWIIVGYIFLIRQGRSVDLRKTGIYIYLTILCAGIVTRALFSHILVMNFFCAFAILVVYVLYLNPDQYMDDIARVFNEKGWQKVLLEIPAKKNFCMVGFGIRNFISLRETRDIEKLNYAVGMVGEWLHRTFPKLSVFYNGNGVFIAASDKSFDTGSVIEQLKDRFDMPWNSDDGEYYLRINAMEMTSKPQRITKTIFINLMWDTYPVLIQADENDVIHINEATIAHQKRREDIQKILREAISEDQLVMYLQPVVNTKNDLVEGAEALCRLIDQNGSIIYPDEFIPLAKRTGSISVLGRQMFRKACAFVSSEGVRFSNIQWVNVNVAPEQFRNPKLLDEFLSDLSEFDLTPDRIHLEITEETMIDRTLLHDSMTRFREKGFIFSMDDFGSSYSNMIRLQQNHFSNVKIDKDFTWSYFRQKTSFLPDIVTTCHNLGMNVVMEGVETKEMLEGAKEIHVDYIQGYYYSKPIGENEFIRKFVTQQ